MTVHALAIIGGGIYGATLACEASRLGLSVVLLEARDLGSGTSFNSLKVIHGGLRYLQSMDVPRALYSAAERNHFLSDSPQLVKPMQCQVGLKRSLMKNELSLSIVARAYNLMTRPTAGQPGVPPARRRCPADLQAGLPVTLKDPGDVVLEWYDAQAEDTERFLLRFLNEAAMRGAVICNYHEVVGLQRADAHWKVEARNQAGETKSYTAQYVVDCSGTAEVAESILDGSTQNKPGSAVKAVNLVVDKKLGDLAFGFNTAAREGGRLLFCAPCQGRTLIGTWYFDEGPDATQISRETAQQCLNEVNSAFVEPVLGLEDIRLVHVGFLPRDASRSGADPESWLLRHNQIKELSGHKNLWIFKGTKYTTARHLAESWLNQHFAEVKVALPTEDADFNTPDAEGWQLDLDESIKAALKMRYGPYLSRVFEFGARYPDLQRPLGNSDSVLAFEVLYAMDAEWACHLDDILVRRLSLGNLGPPSIPCVRDALNILEEAQQWDAQKKQAEIKRLALCYPAWGTAEIHSLTS